MEPDVKKIIEEAHAKYGKDGWTIIESVYPIKGGTGFSTICNPDRTPPSAAELAQMQKYMEAKWGSR